MNAIAKRAFCLLASLAAPLLVLSAAFADPLPGRDVLKFSQQPMDATPIIGPQGTTQLYWGHDELSTAYGTFTATAPPSVYEGTFMADDFADEAKTPVVHVKWWGSYLNNFQTPNFPVDKFLISFESDVRDPNPTDPADFSHPGIPLLNQIVRRVPVGGLAPGSGTYTETPISGGGPPLSEVLYEYNAELHLGKEFRQQPDNVYWLKIVALVDLPPGVAIPDPFNPPTFVPRWGWHNRDFTIMDPLASTPPPATVSPGEHIDGFLPGLPPGGTPVWHFQDDAVMGRMIVDAAGPMGQVMPVITQFGYVPTNYLDFADGPQGIRNFSKDLAFELYTVPEPATCALIIVGLAGIMVAGRRARKES